MQDIIERNALQDKILKERLDTVLPQMMQETGTECWIIASREYDEDPVFPHIVPTMYPTARRLSIFVFFYIDGKLERISIARPDPFVEKYYVREYDPKTQDQLEALVTCIQKRNPKNIAIDISEHSQSYTDGLTVSLYREFQKVFPQELQSRFISADEVGIRFLETRTETELSVYPMVMQEALNIIEAAFSDEVITPGKTTCRDVMNFMTKMVNEEGLTSWFTPDIDLQNEHGQSGEETVIQRGDLLHCDFGITLSNMRTDTQRLCYICKEGESELPEELAIAMKRNNRFQDIVRENMKIGRTGNEVFTASIEQGKKEGLRPVLYTHPLGLFGHSAGPTIGLWDHQKGDIPNGELVIHDKTTYALELSIIEYLGMYQRDTYIFTEESVKFVNNKVEFLGKNRDRIKVIGRN